jgi:3'-5' exoribonuclease
MVSEKLPALPDFPPRLRTLLEHMIISHHGELEFGSPKVPVFAEALLLHHLDNLDSKMEALRSALAREAHSEQEFTGWIPSLERVLLRKQRYVDSAAGSQPAPASQPAKSEPSAPATPVQQPLPVHPAEPVTPLPQREKPPINTLFGEKLQAVLSDRK